MTEGKLSPCPARGRSFMPSGRRWPMIDELPERGGGRRRCAPVGGVREVVVVGDAERPADAGAVNEHLAEHRLHGPGVSLVTVCGRVWSIYLARSGRFI